MGLVQRNDRDTIDYLTQQFLSTSIDLNHVSDLGQKGAIDAKPAPVR